VKTLIISFLLVALASFAEMTSFADQAGTSQYSIEGLANKLQEKVGAGWTVFYKKDFRSIEIKLNKLTRISDVELNMNPEEKPVVDHFSYSLSVFPLVPIRDYQQQRAENQSTLKAMTAIYDVLSKSPTVRGIKQPIRPGIRFSSEVPYEQAKIDKYYRLVDALHRLPDGYFDKISVSWDRNFITASTGPTPVDDGIRRECEIAYKKIIEVPLKY
jgi:hypothetical protein